MRPNGGIEREDLSDGRQNECSRMVSNFSGRVIRHVRDPHTPPGGRIQVNVIETQSVANDGTIRRKSIDDVGGDLGELHQQHIRPARRPQDIFVRLATGLFKAHPVARSNRPLRVKAREGGIRHHNSFGGCHISHLICQMLTAYAGAEMIATMEAIERPKSLTSIAIERLRGAIIDGTLELGSLVSEKQVAELLGTSKTPVREAFAQLQSLGLIEVIPQKGAVVFRPTAEQVRELCEVRLELEIAALRFAINRRNVELSKRLAEIVDEMADARDARQPIAYQRLDNAFHSSFFTYCDNSLLASAYALFYPRICALRTHLSTPQPQLLSRSFEEHKTLAKLVKRREVDRAVRILKEHINRTRECHSKVLTESVLKEAVR